MAAIWELGKIHEATPNEEVAKLFADRLSDIYGTEPEDPRVRALSAVGIGRIKAQSQLPVLQEFANWQEFPGVASLWAISQLEGKPLP